MGYVPGRKSDLFLSYAHAEQDWADKFRDGLCLKLHEKLGAAVEIWQDRLRIDATKKWPKEIEDAVKDAAVFLAICSPSYFASEWCDDERETFLKPGLESLRAKSFYRLLKILKTPCADGSHEDFLKELEPLRFFPEGNLGHHGYAPDSVEFQLGLRNTASVLHEILRAMRNSQETVYVARTNQEIRAERYELINWLGEHSFNVVSQGPNFTDARLRTTLEPVTFCVFAVGPEYDEYFQSQLEAARSLRKRILFWIAPAHESRATGRQAEFIQRIKADAAASWRASLTPSEFVKIDLREWLNPAPAAASTLERKQVYLMHDRAPAEAETAAQLRQLAESSHIAVIPEPAVYPPDEFAARPKLLAQCDGILLFRAETHSSDGWLLQAAGSALSAGDGKPRALVTRTAQPPEWLKDFQLFPFTPPLGPGLLRPFFDLVKQARSADAGRS